MYLKSFQSYNFFIRQFGIEIFYIVFYLCDVKNLIRESSKVTKIVAV